MRQTGTAGSGQAHVWGDRQGLDRSLSRRVPSAGLPMRTPAGGRESDSGLVSLPGDAGGRVRTILHLNGVGMTGFIPADAITG